MTYIAIDDDGLTVDDMDRESIALLAPIDVCQRNVDRQRLADDQRLVGDGDPLVRFAFLHDDIQKTPDDADGWFRQLESLFASIRHWALV